MDFMKSRVLEIKVKQNGTDIANQIFCELIKLFHTVRRLIYGKEEMIVDELTVEAFEIEDKELLIDEIMNKYGQEILQLVYSYVNNKEIAEDVTQDIFVKCYKSLHTYKGKSNVKTWLWRIAINQCKDYVKSWYNKKVIVTEDEAAYIGVQNDSVEQTVIQNAEDRELASAVMNLPIKYREVIYLFYYEELSIKEIAIVIDVKENTIKTRLKKAKELLKKGLEE
ncbi:RNA polymerase sigma factor SigM [Bacillus mobilis]|uniref:RNA polymerase sigma factor SigM n=1 Tax=Bacillus mobilis TaxID=2026190 RepID=A0A1Y6A2Q8_9BACI|nr:RNA polymerase sigma factor SigM [Bacillus mobilis]